MSSTCPHMAGEALELMDEAVPHFEAERYLEGFTRDRISTLLNGALPDQCNELLHRLRRWEARLADGQEELESEAEDRPRRVL